VSLVFWNGCLQEYKEQQVEDVVKWEPLYAVGGNTNQYNPLWKKLKL
jgi:hypothetical protein